MREKYRLPFRERLLCSPAEAGEALDMGKTAIFQLIAQGRLRSVKNGGRRRVFVDSVLEAVGVHDGSREAEASVGTDVGTADS